MISQVLEPDTAETDLAFAVMKFRACNITNKAAPIAENAITGLTIAHR